MLSTMTKEGDAERTDREVLVPWIKFLWDTFRTVLDILRTNSKLELLYHKTAAKAFAFCQTYGRQSYYPLCPYHPLLRTRRWRRNFWISMLKGEQREDCSLAQFQRQSETRAFTV